MFFYVQYMRVNIKSEEEQLRGLPIERIVQGIGNCGSIEQIRNVMKKLTNLGICVNTLNDGNWFNYNEDVFKEHE